VGRNTRFCQSNRRTRRLDRGHNLRKRAPHQRTNCPSHGAAYRGLFYLLKLLSDKFRTVINSPEQTAIYAAKLAKNLAPEDIILLNGNVGAGKSYFCRALIQSVLQYEEDIPSPTFTLVQQ